MRHLATLAKCILLVLSTILAISLPALGETQTKTIYWHNTTHVLGSTTYWKQLETTPDGTAADRSIEIINPNTWYTHSAGEPTDKKTTYDIPTGTKKIKASTWTVYYRAKVETSQPTITLSIDIKILKSDGTERATLASKVATATKSGTSYSTTSTTYSFSEYTVVDDTDYLMIQYWIKSTHAGHYTWIRIDDNGISNALNTHIENIQLDMGDHWYWFNFAHKDRDANRIDTAVTWKLYNGTQELTYTENQTSMREGTSGLFLETYRHNQFIYNKTLSLASEGNTTVSMTLNNMKSHNAVSEGYIASNETVSSITVNSQTSNNLTYTVNGATPSLQIVDVPQDPKAIKINGVTVSSYVYDETTTPHHVRFALNENGTVQLIFGFNYYWFNFAHFDRDGTRIDDKVTWDLYNGTQRLEYTENATSITEDTASLYIETYYHEQFIANKTLSVSVDGNKTVSISLNMKSHANVASGYIASNETISSISVTSETPTLLSYTISGTTPSLQVVDVITTPENLTLNDLPIASYLYDPSTTPKHVRFTLNANGVVRFTFNAVTNGSGSEGGPSGGPSYAFSKRLRILVTYKGAPVAQCNVTAFNEESSYYIFTDPLGRSTFRLKQGYYRIITHSDTLGDRHRTVDLKENYDLTIEYTDADETGGGPLSILPQWDLSSEQGLLFIAIPIGAVLLYAGSTALKSKRKWKYSYL